MDNSLGKHATYLAACLMAAVVLVLSPGRVLAEKGDSPAVDQGAQPITGGSSTFFAVPSANPPGFRGGLRQLRFAFPQGGSDRLDQFGLSHRGPAAYVECSRQGPKFLHTEPVENLFHDAYSMFTAGRRS